MSSTETSQSSWLSPSYYTDWIKNSWMAKQLQAIKTKASAALFTQKQWDVIYHKKEKSTKKSIILAEKSAKIFKQSIEKAAHNASMSTPTGIMARFIHHPEKFLFGASSSSYQYEGGLDGKNEQGEYINASARFYHNNNLPLAGDAIDFWNRYKDDIK